MGVSGGKGSSSTQSQQTSSFSPPSWLLQAGQAAVNQALPLSQAQFPIPTQPIAGLTPSQQMAMQNVAGITGAGAGQNLSQPYLNAGTILSGLGSRPNIGQYFGAESAGVLPELQQIFGQQTAQQIGNLTQQAGGPTSDRIGVGLADLANQQGLAAGQTLSGIMGQSVGQALQGGQLMEQAGNQIANIGPAAQTSALQAQQALLSAGTLQQQQMQNAINASYENVLQQVAWPYETTGYLASMAAGLSPAMGGVGVTSGNTQSAMTNMGGSLGGKGGGGGLLSGMGAMKGVATGGRINADEEVYKRGKDSNPYARGGMVNPFSDGGWTVNEMGSTPSSGYMVSLPDHEQIIHGKTNKAQRLAYTNKYADELHRPGNYFGGWEDNGDTYLDVSRNYRDKTKAMDAAKQGHQLAIYDLKHHQSMPTRAEGGHVSRETAAIGGPFMSGDPSVIPAPQPSGVELSGYSTSHQPNDPFPGMPGKTWGDISQQQRIMEYIYGPPPTDPVLWAGQQGLTGSTPAMPASTTPLAASPAMSVQQAASQIPQIPPLAPNPLGGGFPIGSGNFGKGLGGTGAMPTLGGGVYPQSQSTGSAIPKGFGAGSPTLPAAGSPPAGGIMNNPMASPPPQFASQVGGMSPFGGGNIGMGGGWGSGMGGKGGFAEGGPVHPRYLEDWRDDDDDDDDDDRPEIIAQAGDQIKEWGKDAISDKLKEKAGSLLEGGLLAAGMAPGGTAGSGGGSSATASGGAGAGGGDPASGNLPSNHITAQIPMGPIAGALGKGGGGPSGVSGYAGSASQPLSGAVQSTLPNGQPNPMAPQPQGSDWWKLPSYLKTDPNTGLAPQFPLSTTTQWPPPGWVNAPIPTIEQVRAEHAADVQAEQAANPMPSGGGKAGGGRVTPGPDLNHILGKLYGERDRMLHKDSGGPAVSGIQQLLASLQPPPNVTGQSPAQSQMPSGQQLMVPNITQGTPMNVAHGRVFDVPPIIGRPSPAMQWAMSQQPPQPPKQGGSGGGGGGSGGGGGQNPAMMKAPNSPTVPSGFTQGPPPPPTPPSVFTPDNAAPAPVDTPFAMGDSGDMFSYRGGRHMDDGGDPGYDPSGGSMPELQTMSSPPTAPAPAPTGFMGMSSLPGTSAENMPSIAQQGYYNLASGMFNQPSPAQQQAQQQAQMSQIGNMARSLLQPQQGQQQQPQGQPATFDQRFGQPSAVPNAPVTPFSSGAGPQQAPQQYPAVPFAPQSNNSLVPVQTTQGDLAYASKDSLKQIDPQDAAHQEAIQQTLNTVGLRSPAQNRQQASKLDQLLQTIRGGVNPSSIVGRMAGMTPPASFNDRFGNLPPSVPAAQTPFGPKPSAPDNPASQPAQQAPVPLPQPRPSSAPQAGAGVQPPSPAQQMLDAKIGDLAHKYMSQWVSNMIPQSLNGMTLRQVIQQHPDWRTNPQAQAMIQSVQKSTGVSPQDIENALKPQSTIPQTSPQQATPQQQYPAGSVQRAYQNLGATPGEMQLLHIESGFQNHQVTGNNYGHAQFSPDLMKKYGITNPDDPAQVLQGIRKERADFERKVGHPLTDGQFYLMHQQGEAGGPALMNADPHTPAWQAVRQFYPSEAVAKQAIWGNVPDNMKGQFGSVENVSASQFASLWENRFGQSGNFGQPVNQGVMTASRTPQQAEFQRVADQQVSKPVQINKGQLFTMILGGMNPRDALAFQTDVLNFQNRAAAINNLRAQESTSPSSWGDSLADEAEGARGLIQKHSPETTGNAAAEGTSGQQGAKPAGEISGAPSGTVGPTSGQQIPPQPQSPSGAQLGAGSAHMAELWDENTRMMQSQFRRLETMMKSATMFDDKEGYQAALNGYQQLQNQRTATATALIGAQANELAMRKNGFEKGIGGLWDYLHTTPDGLPTFHPYSEFYPGQGQQPRSQQPQSMPQQQQGQPSAPQMLPAVPLTGGQPQVAPIQPSSAGQPLKPGEQESPHQAPEWNRSAPMNSLPRNMMENADYLDPSLRATGLDANSLQWVGPNQLPQKDMVQKQWEATINEQYEKQSHALHALQLVQQMRAAGDEKDRTTGSVTANINNLLGYLAPGHPWIRHMFSDLPEGSVPSQERIKALQDRLTKEITNGSATGDAGGVGAAVGRIIGYFGSSTPGSTTTTEGFNADLDDLESDIDRANDKATFITRFGQASGYMGDRNLAVNMFEHISPPERYQELAEQKAKAREARGDLRPPGIIENAEGLYNRAEGALHNVQRGTSYLWNRP